MLIKGDTAFKRCGRYDSFTAKVVYFLKTWFCGRYDLFRAKVVYFLKTWFSVAFF